jgi:hypothetical protein
VVAFEIEPADPPLLADNFPFGNTSTLPWRPAPLRVISKAIISSNAKFLRNHAVVDHFQVS